MKRVWEPLAPLLPLILDAVAPLLQAAARWAVRRPAGGRSRTPWPRR